MSQKEVVLSPRGGPSPGDKCHTVLGQGTVIDTQAGCEASCVVFDSTVKVYCTN